MLLDLLYKGDGPLVSCFSAIESLLQRLYISLARFGLVKILIDTEYTDFITVFAADR